MLEHHIQKSIIKALARRDSSRFSDLRPADIENKAFDYHLKQLLIDKLVIKNSSGEYELTALGRKLAVSATSNLKERAERAFSVLFLVVRSEKGWLMYRRKSHPLKDRVGFMHARPVVGETVQETAKRICREKTGLDCSFIYRASGYFTVFKGSDVESYTHFTLLVADGAQGDLTPNDDSADYYWELEPNFSAVDMLPNMKDLVKLLSSKNEIFLEKTYQI